MHPTSLSRETPARSVDELTFQHFQMRIAGWMDEVFGQSVTGDVRERTVRFLEEAVELAQAVGVAKADVARVSDYVYSRPVGDPSQEVGGVLVTLAALCGETKINLEYAVATEFDRIDTVEMRTKIRAKQDFKRSHGL
jgi:NTP pyrophosphatase (non-canonical NTP hydrolase)